jgi:hypothetical protein
MSWLSEAWRKMKGGRSDIQTAGDLLVLGLNSAQKVKLRTRMLPVAFAVGEATKYSNDPRVNEAKIVIDEFLVKLEP